LLIYLADKPDASLSDIAAAIGRSRSTAGNYVNELTTDGRLHKNGHGWEVLDGQAS
jgi:DNA-binding IclR family transcriptional regulator